MTVDIKHPSIEFTLQKAGCTHGYAIGFSQCNRLFSTYPTNVRCTVTEKIAVLV